MMVNLEFSEFEMQYGNGIAESLDAAGIDYSIHAGIAPSPGAEAERENAPVIQGDRAGDPGKSSIAGVGGAGGDSSTGALA